MDNRITTDDRFRPLSEAESSAALHENVESHAAQNEGGSAKTTKIPIIPVPADAPTCSFRHPKYGEPDGMWAYHKADSGLVGYDARFNFETNGQADKDFLPITFCELIAGGKANRRAWRAC